MNPDNPLLEAAIVIWAYDLPISVDHWVELTNLGYEVERLERQYRP